MIRLIPFHKKNIKIFFSLSFLILLSCSQDLNKSNFYDLPFSNQTIFEDEIDFSSFENNNILLNFWFPSCPPCVYELEILDRINSKSSATKVIGVQVLGLDTKEDGKRMFLNKGISYPSVADEKDKVISTLDITVFPTTILFDKNGKEYKRWLGIIDEELVFESVKELENSK